MKHDSNVMKADCADSCHQDEHKEERPARLGSEIHTRLRSLPLQSAQQWYTQAAPGFHYLHQKTGAEP